MVQIISPKKDPSAPTVFPLVPFGEASLSHRFTAPQDQANSSNLLDKFLFIDIILAIGTVL